MTYRPTFQQQGPASNCVITGRPVGWLSCTAYSAAMLVERSTLGKSKPTGCDVRRRTGDTTGGLSLPQVAAAVAAYGVNVEQRIGSRACHPTYAAGQLRSNRGLLLQGSTGPLLGTEFRSTNGRINHAVYVNEVRGGTATVPKEALVYDPAADGRRTGIDAGPSWWPWSLVMRFAAELQPWGESDSRRLGTGRMYAGFGPGTPYVRLIPGAVLMRTLPNRKRVKAGFNVRAAPGGKPVAGTVAGSWEIWQSFTGKPVAGNPKWWGSRDGTRWIHDSALVGR